MDRRDFIFFGASTAIFSQVGCRGYQYGHLIKDESPNLVGSHAAGAEVFDPLIDESVAKLLARQQQVGPDAVCGPDGVPLPKTICFIGVENKSVEELGDFKDQIYQQIDTKILESQTFNAVSRRMVDAALQETRMRPDALLVPDNMRLFTAVLERNGQPIDYLLYATLTSGTTERNNSSQRDYNLTLEIVNVHNGFYDKQSAEVRKGYHKSSLGKWWHYNPLKS